MAGIKKNRLQSEILDYTYQPYQPNSGWAKLTKCDLAIYRLHVNFVAKAKPYFDNQIQMTPK